MSHSEATAAAEVEGRLKAFSHWNPMRIECAFNAHWEISHPMRIGANAHSKWIESTSAQSTSRGGLKWIEVD